MENNRGMTIMALVLTIVAFIILSCFTIVMFTNISTKFGTTNNIINKYIESSLEQSVKTAVKNIKTVNSGWPENVDVMEIIEETKKVNNSIENLFIDATITEETGNKEGEKTEIKNKFIVLKGILANKEQKVKVNLINGNVSKVYK